MLRIAIIIGSTRPGRNGEAVAKWVYEIAQRRGDAKFELVDIKDFNLPLLDEPMSPMMGQYTQDAVTGMLARLDDQERARLYEGLMVLRKLSFSDEVTSDKLRF